MSRVILFVYLLISAVFVDGQTAEWATYSYTETIQAMAEDGDYLWLGTTGGLIRYNKLDGTSSHFNKTNTPLLSNGIGSLVIDGNGSLWIGTNNGLTVHNGKRWTTFTSANSILPSSDIYAIAIGDDGAVWIGTGSGLVKQQNGNWSVWHPYPANAPYYGLVSCVLPLRGDTVWIASFRVAKLFKLAGSVILDSIVLGEDNGSISINSMYEDSNGDLLISTSQGLFRHIGDSSVFINSMNSPLPTNQIEFTFRDPDGCLWIGTCCRGLIQVDDTVWTVHNPIHSGINTSCLYSLVMIQPGHFWITSSGAGLLEFNHGTWTQHQTANSPLGYTYDDIHVIITDHAGITWMGTNSGIRGFRDNTWTHLPLYDSLYHSNDPQQVRYLAVDHNNVLWAANWGSLIRIENGSWTKIYQSNWPLVQGYIRSLAVGPDGYVYFTAGAHLYRYDGTTCIVLDNTNSGFTGGSDPILSSDRNGILWITDYGKVTRYDGHSWTTWNQSNSPLPAKYLLTAVTDLAGVLWIGSEGDGLIRFDGMFWDFYSPDNSALPFYRIKKLEVCQENYLWAIELYGSSVAMLDGGLTVTHFTPGNSPLPGGVLSLHIDPFNNKWFGMGWGNGVTIHNSAGLKLSANHPGSIKAPVAEVWPNPFSDALQVKLPGFCAGCLYQISDMHGRVVMEGVLSETLSRINTRSLAPGVYIFTVTGNKVYSSQKIIRQN